MSEEQLVVGIDLGTTNSEIAAYLDDRVRVIGNGGGLMLPSCVGISPDGELLVGAAARNQSLVYPERAVSSIKRKMGTSAGVVLGEREFSPQEISALILRELADWAKRRIGHRVRRAVITVPAYFSDAQRSATREAGALAGLEVTRILNEPTAAALAYGYGEEGRRTLLIYDLGGGTFDVSIVALEGEVTEVLASHGNNRLGGDDFDELVLERLAVEFAERHDVDVREYPAAYSRLRWAAERAKRALSDEPHVTVREESLVTVDGKPLHLEMELSRTGYEEQIRSLVESTFDSVSRALEDASLQPRDLDAILLVGGATRTPLVSAMLEERTGVTPRQEVDPDLCVALGAGVMASRLSGREVERVLVDISPYSFGPSHLGKLHGRPYGHCYRPIIRRNTPLPVTRTESYYTVMPYQDGVDLEIYQGDDPDALKNILVGHFHVGGLTPTADPNEVLCRMSLDLDGILDVTAIEKRTGLSKQITVRNALEQKSELEIAAARARLQEFHARRAARMGDPAGDGTGQDGPAGAAEVAPAGRGGLCPAPRAVSGESSPEDASRGDSSAGDSSDSNVSSGDFSLGDVGWTKACEGALLLVTRSRDLLSSMHQEDREEAVDLHDAINRAIEASDGKALSEASESLRELLFFIEG